MPSRKYYLFFGCLAIFLISIGTVIASDWRTSIVHITALLFVGKIFYQAGVLTHLD